MKRFVVLLLSLLLITGCSKDSSEDIKDKFIKKVDNCNSYVLKGNLELRNNDEVYNYNVEVNYKKKNYYKVSLTNKSNNMTQVIVKNDDGVYILTPMLNRSFKFQSDWPYNNSQIYLLKALRNDIKNDDDYKINSSKKYITINSKVNYPNNSSLKYQKLYFNKNGELLKVIVYDNDDIPCMELKIKSIDYSPSLKKDNFDLNNIMNDYGSNEKETMETTHVYDSIYPLSLPDGTVLTNEEKISKDQGERVLMTFEGDKPFLLVEETVDIMDEFTIIPTNGVPYQLMDTLGVMTDNSLSWVSNGIEYYLVSDVLSTNELVDIAQSIYVLPTSK